MDPTCPYSAWAEPGSHEIHESRVRSRHSGNAVQALPTSSEPGPAKFVRADLVCQPGLMIHPCERGKFVPAAAPVAKSRSVGRASMARQGKGVLRGKPAARKASKQQAISQVGLLPELKKPAEAIGKFIKLPGSFWDGRLSAEEKSALFKCAVVQFSAVHTFADGHKAAAFQLQEMYRRWASLAQAAWSTAMPRATSSGCSTRRRF